MTSAHKILVVGSGSIGRRHATNLRGLGAFQIAACDTDTARLDYMVEKFGIISFSSIENALTEFEPTIVFICTPPVYHIQQAKQALAAHAHVFIEKPLSHTNDGVTELIELARHNKRVVAVGYNFRHHAGLQRVKQLLDDQVIGRILWGRLEVGQYLPDWRPWQDYRLSYTARNDLGGGIILDGSHELDYATWLFGNPSSLVCMAGQVSSLQVDVEDCATILLRFPSGAQIDVHLDFIQRNYSRNCKIVGDQGTLEWDYSRQEIRITRNGNVEMLSYDFDPNQMYVAEVEEFLAAIEKNDISLDNLTQARNTLAIALAAKKSATEGTVQIL